MAFVLSVFALVGSGCSDQNDATNKLVQQQQEQLEHQQQELEQLQANQNALLACPNDEKAEVNVARSYEALGNKVAAINLYRKVADSNSATVSDAQEEAKAALLRLQAARMP
jgi:predicted Rossmann fold nucleotide-binding protein DprA/Smf involved in DNA uptake